MKPDLKPADLSRFAEALRETSFTALFSCQNLPENIACKLSNRLFFADNPFFTSPFEKNLNHKTPSQVPNPPPQTVKSKSPFPGVAGQFPLSTPRTELHQKRFHELLEEYNHTSRKRLTSSFQVGRNSPRKIIENPEVVERISLSEIPGKILRPV